MNASSCCWDPITRTFFFEQFVNKDNRGGLLIGAGILTATKEQLAARNLQLASTNC